MSSRPSPARIDVARFRPDRSQSRAWKANAGEVRLEVGAPGVTAAKLGLYDRYHAFQAGSKGWPEHAPKGAGEYADSFVHNPFPTEEWCYYLADRLIDGFMQKEEFAAARELLTRITKQYKLESDAFAN